MTTEGEAHLESWLREDEPKITIIADNDSQSSSLVEVLQQHATLPRPIRVYGASLRHSTSQLCKRTAMRSVRACGRDHAVHLSGRMQPLYFEANLQIAHDEA